MILSVLASIGHVSSVQVFVGVDACMRQIKAAGPSVAWLSELRIEVTSVVFASHAYGPLELVVVFLEKTMPFTVHSCGIAYTKKTTWTKTRCCKAT